MSNYFFHFFPFFAQLTDFIERFFSTPPNFILRYSDISIFRHIDRRQNVTTKRRDVVTIKKAASKERQTAAKKNVTAKRRDDAAAKNVTTKRRRRIDKNLYLGIVFRFLRFNNFFKRFRC